MTTSLAPISTEVVDIALRVEHEREEHTLYVVESSQPLSETAQLFMLRRFASKKLCNESGNGRVHYPSNDVDARPHVTVFLAVGDARLCISSRRHIELELRSLINHPAHP